jgi:hypothetical protein
MASDRLAGGGYISFADSLHGWANLNIQSGSAFNIGALLSTSDGGRSWRFVEGDPGSSGPVVLQKNGNGWILHDGGEELIATSDGGETFHQVQLAPPVTVSIEADSSHTIHDLPVFLDSRRGYEPVIFSNKDGSKSDVVLFKTSDGGISWTADRRLTGLGPSSIRTIESTSITDSTWIVPVAPSGAVPSLMVLEGGTTASFPTRTPNSIRRSSFISATQGWIASTLGLFSTADGGKSWQNITPTFTIGGGLGSVHDITDEQFDDGLPKPAASSITNASLTATMQPLEDDDPPPIAAGRIQYLGFDKSQIPTTTQMLDWWNNSPYYIYGFYLNGALSHSYQPDLTASWISTVRGYGWGLIPIWAGLQPPCACRYGKGTYPTCRTYPNVFSSDPAIAMTQGESEADAAYNSALSLNLDGGIIYVDMEQFSSAACGAAAQAFLSGWVQEMAVDATSVAGGVYGSLSNAASDFAVASPAPNDVFLAWSSKRFTVWNLQHGLSDANWPDHQRSSQLWEQQSQTWGSTAMSIDTDITDGLGYPPTAGCPTSPSVGDVGKQYR